MVVGYRWRASYLWVACLIRYQGSSLDDAWGRGRAVGTGSHRLAELLDSLLKLIYADGD